MTPEAPMTPESKHLEALANAALDCRNEGLREGRQIVERLRVRLELLRDKIDGGKYEDASLLIEMILGEMKEVHP